MDLQIPAPTRNCIENESESQNNLITLLKDSQLTVVDTIEGAFGLLEAKKNF